MWRSLRIHPEGDEILVFVIEYKAVHKLGVQDLHLAFVKAKLSMEGYPAG